MTSGDNGIKVLVVIPTHNRTEFLDEAMQSLADQTRRADQVVVIGNVAPSQPGDYAYIHSDDTLSGRLNSAIENSDCDAFILLSDDDLLLPKYIEKTVPRMEETGADIVYTEFGEEQVTSLVRKSIWKRVGGFCEIGFFDWDFWLSCREAGAVAVGVREHLYVYRQHPAQVATHKRQALDGTWAAWDAAILAKHPTRKPHRL